ncbi:uncharacterized protein V6R79_021624 [Siganus canaliculatus]
MNSSPSIKSQFLAAASTTEEESGGLQAAFRGQNMDEDEDHGDVSTQDPKDQTDLRASGFIQSTLNASINRK